METPPRPVRLTAERLRYHATAMRPVTSCSSLLATLVALGGCVPQGFDLTDASQPEEASVDAGGAIAADAADGAYTDRDAVDVRDGTAAVESAWSLSREIEIESTDEGGDLTWALDPFPYETWRRDLYGRGDLVDRYRR